MTEDDMAAVVYAHNSAYVCTHSGFVSPKA